jgi:hypothetical protein
MGEQDANARVRRTQGLQQHCGGSCFTQRYSVDPHVTTVSDGLCVMTKAFFDGVQIASFFTATALQFVAQQRL